MANMYREIWEGWRPIDFIEEMKYEVSMIMDDRFDIYEVPEKDVKLDDK